MVVRKGDLIKLIRPFAFFGVKDIGTVFEITKVNEDNSVVFNFRPDTNQISYICTINQSEFEKYFEYAGFISQKIDNQKNIDKNISTFKADKDTKENKEEINLNINDLFDRIISKSDVKVFTLFGKTTVVAVQFPNKYVIVESSSCVSSDDYSKDLGVKLCMKRIKQRYIEHIAFEECDSTSNWDSLEKFYNEDIDKAKNSLADLIRHLEAINKRVRNTDKM